MAEKSGRIDEHSGQWHLRARWKDNRQWQTAGESFSSQADTVVPDKSARQSEEKEGRRSSFELVVPRNKHKQPVQTTTNMRRVVSVHWQCIETAPFGEHREQILLLRRSLVPWGSRVNNSRSTGCSSSNRGTIGKRAILFEICSYETLCLERFSLKICQGRSNLNNSNWTVEDWLIIFY